MPVQDFPVLGEFFTIAISRYDLSLGFCRPGALIAGTWAVMQHIGTE